MNKKIAVIVPAYNEEFFISQTVKSIPNEIDIIICVDDRSKDNTYATMLSLTKQDLRVRVVQTDRNGGIGHAVKTGIAQVVDRVDYVSVIPGDNQCDATLIPRFVRKCEEENLVCCKGNRFLGKNNTQTMPKNRKVGNIIYSLVTMVVSGYYTIFDSQHGFCAIRTHVLRNELLNQIRNDYLFDNSIWIVLNSVQARIGEVASPVRYQGEVSDVKYFKFVLASIGYFIHAYFWRIRKRYGTVNFIYSSMITSCVFLISTFVYANIWYGMYAITIMLWALFFDYWNDPNKIFSRQTQS